MTPKTEAALVKFMRDATAFMRAMRAAEAKNERRWAASDERLRRTDAEIAKVVNRADRRGAQEAALIREARALMAAVQKDVRDAERERKRWRKPIDIGEFISPLPKGPSPKRPA